MPVYEYRCEHCGDFEEMQRISAPPLTRCPKCRRKVRRLISNTSFQLKGGGWYVTDYPRAGTQKDAVTDKPAGESKAEGKAESKAESKAEGKAEGKAESKADSKADGKAASKPASSTTATP